MRGFLSKLAVLLVLCFSFAGGTKAEVSAYEYWGTYTTGKNINSSLSWSTRLGWRQFDVDNNVYRIGLSPQLQHKRGQLKTIVGARLFYCDSPIASPGKELRPWLGVGYKQNSILSHSAKWEHRFRDGSTKYVSRFRYCIKANWTLCDNEQRKLTLGFAPEVFSDLGEMDAFKAQAIRWVVPVALTLPSKVTLELAPFLQTNHNGIFDVSDQYLLVFRLNVKNLLK